MNRWLLQETAVELPNLGWLVFLALALMGVVATLVGLILVAW